MQVKSLAADKFEIVAVMHGENCPAEEFLAQGDAGTESYRGGLFVMLTKIAEVGFEGVSSSWLHEASKRDRIFEFRKGPLRLFFFKGVGRLIVVCTVGTRKKTQRADPRAVASSVAMRKEYFDAVKSNNLKVINED